MQQYQANSYLFGGNAPYVEELYEAYLNNPGSVPDNWRAYFDAMQHVPAVDHSWEEPAGPLIEEGPGLPAPAVLNRTAGNDARLDPPDQLRGVSVGQRPQVGQAGDELAPDDERQLERIADLVDRSR